MKNVILFFLILVLPLFHYAQNTWQTHAEMGFKILVPANYQQNQFSVFKGQQAFAHYSSERTQQIINENISYPQNAVANFHFGVTAMRVSFSSSGITCGAPFILKNYSRLHDQNKEAYASNTSKRSNSQGFYGDNGDAWLPGNYSFEIGHGGKMPGTRDYTFQYFFLKNHNP